MQLTLFSDNEKNTDKKWSKQLKNNEQRPEKRCWKVNYLAVYKINRKLEALI